MKTASLCLAGTLAGLCSAATAEEWHYSLGLGASNAPRYSGSDERVSAPLVNLEVEGPYGFSWTWTKGSAGNMTGRTPVLRSTRAPASAARTAARASMARTA